MTDAPHTVKVRLRVEGMDCASCAIKIETALHRLAGVSDVVVSVPAGTVIVTHDRRELEDRIRDRISGLGYQVTGSEQIGVKTLHLNKDVIINLAMVGKPIRTSTTTLRVVSFGGKPVKGCLPSLPD